MSLRIVRDDFSLNTSLSNSRMTDYEGLTTVDSFRHRINGRHHRRFGPTHSVIHYLVLLMTYPFCHQPNPIFHKNTITIEN